ncbi:MAG: hypothetical protein LBQ77_08445 [Treponema sp.]|jgi:cellobiose-specific phosphotransferase system component IIC|nr:hypothetical protein [Treponema sp.]
MIIPLVAIASIFVLLPAIVFSFIYKTNKDKIDLKKIELQAKTLTLEIEKQRIYLETLKEENKKYDSLLRN